MTREEALALLKKYNKEPFHLQHAFTVEGVMRWYANELGHGDEADFWALVGLLHDVDFEQWPEQHCKKAPELLAEIGADDAFVHAVCSHGYGLCSDVEPLLDLIQQAAGISRESARMFHLEMWIYVHGIAAMAATSFLDWDTELISAALTDAYRGLLARFKEKEAQE